MSTGFFMGIKESYIPEAVKNAENYIKAINKVLIGNNIGEYIESEKIPDVYKNGFFGQSGLDHHGSSSLAELAEFAETKIQSKHLRLIKLNPYRVAFVPINFELPFATDYKETFWGNNSVNLNAGSSYKLKEELIEVAKHLGIEFNNGNLLEEQVKKINELEPFTIEEDENLTEIFRSPWLVLYEGARLSIENKIALSLAG